MREYINCRMRLYSILDMLGALLLLAVAFPYVQLIPSNNYTQPYALILGAILFLTRTWPVLLSLRLYDLIALVGLGFVGVATYLLTCFPYVEEQEYKYLISYLTPIFLTIPLLGYLRNNIKLTVAVLRFSIWLWLFVAVVQKFLDPSFLGFMIGQWSESTLDIIESGRGVLGLAPEPTHHGFHILLLATCLAMLDASKNSRRLLFLCAFDAVVLAASSSSVLVLGIATIFWIFIYQRRQVFLLVMLILVVFGSAEPLASLIDNRIGQLINAVLLDPASILTIDYSMNTRLGGFIAVFYQVFSNGFIPFGMSIQAWDSARNSLLIDLPWLLDLSLAGPPSGVGVILFQTGLLGAVLLGLIFKTILSTNVSGLGRILLMGAPLIFLSQYYISAPTFSLLYACALYRSRIKIVNYSGAYSARKTIEK
jgi:hypothetical protein